MAGFINKPKQEDPKEEIKEPKGSLFNREQDDKIVFNEVEPRWDLDEIILNPETKEEIKDISFIHKNYSSAFFCLFEQGG